MSKSPRKSKAPRVEAVKRYQEPLGHYGPSMFPSEEERRAIDTAFERFKRRCQTDPSVIGPALLEHADAIYTDFGDMWRFYWNGRRDEELALRAEAKPYFTVLLDSVSTLQRVLADERPAVRRYLREGIGRRFTSYSPSDATARVEQLKSGLEDLAEICRVELAIDHRTGSREDEPLFGLCKMMRKMIELHARVRVSKTLELVDGEFVNEHVHALCELLRCIDERLTSSKVKAALGKLPPSAKNPKLPRK